MMCANTSIIKGIKMHISDTIKFNISIFIEIVQHNFFFNWQNFIQQFLNKLQNYKNAHKKICINIEV